jgi:hypothetical protein
LESAEFKSAGERATKTMGRQTDRARETLDKDLFHLQALRLVKKLPNKTFVYRSNLW